jgi:hypothetical protein
LRGVGGLVAAAPQDSGMPAPVVAVGLYAFATDLWVPTSRGAGARFTMSNNLQAAQHRDRRRSGKPARVDTGRRLR